METRTNKPGRTAITRKAVSLPTAYLLQHGLIKGEALDYGCGKGFDCDFLGMDGYDPNHGGRCSIVVDEPGYDTIICNYVLNVLPDASEREDVVLSIIDLLAPGGVAYITVRNDSFTEGWTSRDTWQGKVSVPWGTLFRATSGYRMYKVCN